MLLIFRHYRDDLEYDMPFDINLKDVSGQNTLYITCQMGNQRLVDMLLKYRVESRKIGESPKTRKPVTPSESDRNLVESTKDSKSSSPNKRRVSEGIQGIISKLSVATNQKLITAKV